MVPRKRSGKKVPQNGRDVINVNNRGDNNAIAAGRGAKAVVSQGVSSESIDAWRRKMEKSIDALKGLLPEDKVDLIENVGKVAGEISKGKKVDAGRLERLLNSIGSMAPDIFDVAITTLANPLAGIGLVVKKIGDKAKLTES